MPENFLGDLLRFLPGTTRFSPALKNGLTINERNQKEKQKKLKE